MRTQRIALILICLVAGVAPVSAPDAAEIDLFAWDACQHEWRVDVATQATVAGVSVHWQPDMYPVGPWSPSEWESGLQLVPQPGSQFPATIHVAGPVEADYGWLANAVLCTHYSYYPFPYRVCDMTPELVCNSAPLPAKGETNGWQIIRR